MSKGIFWRPRGANYVSVPSPEEEQRNREAVRKLLDERYGPGHVIAAAIKADAEDIERGPWQGVTQTCHSCERTTIEHLEDFECAECRGELPDDTEERRKARVELYQRTAKRCREWGDEAGALWFEGRIKAEGGE